MAGNEFGHRRPWLSYVIGQEYGAAELYIDQADAVENKRIFDQLHARKEEIEKAFGGTLSWEGLDTKRAFWIKHLIERGGYRSSELQWPAIQAEMVETMTKLEVALKPDLAALGF